MQLDQASLGSPTNLHLGGYIPAPIQHDSVLKQALLAFLGNAAGAAGTRMVGAGANAMGQFTPEETLAQRQVAETARHNVAGEGLGAEELMQREAEREAKYAMLHKQFGLDERLGLGNLDLGKGRLGIEQGQLAEGARHNVATEGEAGKRTAIDAELAKAQGTHFGAQTKQLDAGTNMQMHVQRQMALQEVLKGVDPKSPQAMFLTQAANDVPFDGDIQKFGQAVHAHAQAMAKAQMGGGAGVPSAQTGPSMAERGGLLKVAGEAFDPYTQATQVLTDPQNLMKLQKLKAFLMGNEPPITAAPPVPPISAAPFPQ